MFENVIWAIFSHTGDDGRVVFDAGQRLVAHGGPCGSRVSTWDSVRHVSATFVIFD